MFLFDTDSIRKKIQLILSRRQGERYAIVAFVGKDALDFVREPDGLTVYCWNNVAATNPDGVKKLKANGATVYFVDRLHMKLFWSERGGAVIGSPNLTSNALGAGNALRETAYFFNDSKDIPISEVLNTLKATRRLVTDSVLAAYTKKYNLASARGDEFSANKVKSESLLSFSNFAAGASLQSFRLTCWSGYNKAFSKATLKAVADLADENGISKEPAKFIFDSIDVDFKPAIGEWLLCCRIGKNGSLGRTDWLFVHTIARVRKNSSTWTAIEVRKSHTDPPFDCKEKRFNTALSTYADEIALEETADVRMSPTRVARLASLYTATAAKR